ncbi:MAG: ribosome small subunit-dependent GTPase A, partial [Coriobacteriia bacterium]|nr:ribosome small subunit-dependent GTPase A [Coriobacteriia bacterium]
MADLIDLATLGLNDRVAALARQHPGDLTLGRVVRADRGFAFVMTPAGMVIGRPATRLVKAADDGGLPVVGDWVLIGGDASEPLIEVVLERATSIVRRDPGRAA